MEAGRKRLVLILLALVVAGGLLAFAFGADIVGASRAVLEEVRSRGAAVFFGAMALLPVVGFPLAPFVFSAGPLFAPQLGVTGVIALGIGAIACNVSLSYWVASRPLRGVVERLVAWLGYRMPELPRNRDWEAVLILRIVPGIPFFVQSYLLGLARIRFGIYLLVSILVPSAYLAAAVLAGDAVMKRNQPRLLLAGLIFAAVGAALHFTRKRLMRRRSGEVPPTATGGSPN